MADKLYRQTIWYEIYTGRNINWESFTKYFGKNGDDESWYIYYIEEDSEPRFELHAHIDGDAVVSAEPFKAEVYGGHGRPTIDEKSLTSSEKKYAISIFEECFPDRVGDALEGIIDAAIASNVEYGGYNILKRGSDYVVFLSPEGKKVKLNHKILAKAIDYSHLDLAILRDPVFIREFANCFGVKTYEPLAAIMLTISPESHNNYVELERKYRYEKMEEAVASGDIKQCETYIDVLSDSENNALPFCATAVAQNNKTMLAWLIDNISGAKCNLSSLLGTAVRKNNEELFYYLLNSGLIDASDSDSTQGNSPMYAAAYYKGNEKYIMPLLQRGFSLSAKTGYRLFSTYTMDEIAALLPYAVDFDQNTVNRIYAEGRADIITQIEQEPLRFCSRDALFAAYVHSGDFVKFSTLLKEGFSNNSHELFALAYKHSSAWTDLWLRNGFDVNCNDGKLLHKACEDLDVDFAIYLLENGADPHLKGQYSQTVFEKAGGFHGYLSDEQQKEKERLCKYLLDIGLDPIAESRKGPSILMYLLGRTEAFDLLLVDWLAEHNKINCPDLPEECKDTKQLPIAHIMDKTFGRYNPVVLRYFIQKGAITNAEGITDDRIFIDACEICDLPELQLVVSAGANIHEITKNYSNKGTNGLYAAVACRRPYEIIQYLVELGLDVNSVSPAKPWSWGSSKMVPATSILDVAERHSDQEIIDYLKSHGALHATEIV